MRINCKASYTLLIWNLLVIQAVESNLLVKYHPYQTSQGPKPTAWISEGPNKRQDSDVRVIHRDTSITPEGCVRTTHKPIIGQVTGADLPCDNKCKGQTLTLNDLASNSWSLSILLRIECMSNYNVKLLAWQDLAIEMQCDSNATPSIHLANLGERTSCRIHKNYAHLLIQTHSLKGSSSRVKMAVFINGSNIELDSNTKRNGAIPKNAAALTLGSDTGYISKTNQSGGTVVKTIELFKKELTDVEIKKEAHFMYLKSINADYPECLCTEPPPYGTDSCPNGEDRMRGEDEDKPFLPIQAVMDGKIITGTMYGFWPAKRKDNIFLRLEAPTWISGMEIFIFTQPITVFKEICDRDKWHPLFCASGQKPWDHEYCSEGSGYKTYNWDDTEGGLEHKLTWTPGQDIHVLRTLQIVFEAGPDHDITNIMKPLININPVFEIRVFGIVLDRTGFSEDITCFPGNGNYTVEHEECGRCHCRDENKTSSTNNCRPYISSLSPSFGPVSGGTNLTLSGGLLLPEIDQACHYTTIFIPGYMLCNNTQRTDDNITCRTLPLVYPDLVGLQQKLTMNILIDGAMYAIDSLIAFSYKKDPTIESVTPYKSFLGGGHVVTMKGENLDSIYIKPEGCILTITIMGTPESQYNAHCTLVNMGTLKCTMPAIDEVKTVKAHLSLTLDGVTRYKNLSAALNLSEPMEIYPTPAFENEVTVNSSSDSTILNLKGQNIDTGCAASEYEVRIGASECTVTKIEYNSLSCILRQRPQKDGKVLSGHVVVELYSFIYNIGYVQVEGAAATSINLEIIISIVGGVFLIILIACGLFIFWWRRTVLGKPHVPEANEGPSDQSTNTDSVRPSLASITNPVNDNPSKVLDGLEIDSRNLKVQDNFGKDSVRPSLASITNPVNDDLSKILDGIEIDSRNLKIKEEIGKGHTSKVFSGILTDSSGTREVAVKTMKDADPEALNEFLKEATIMKGFDHPNVLSLLGIIMEKNHPFVILPYVEHGDLRGFVQNSRFEEVRFTKLIYDVAKGMDYLAEKKFVHRDLAARNCMVDSSEHVLVGDFGLARDIHEQDYYRPKDRSKPLPYKWMALESIKILNFSLMSDIWSFGVTMWEVYSHGAKPYPDIRNSQMRSYLKRGLRLEQPPTCPIEIFELMAQCWTEQPCDRPTFKQIVSKLERFILQSTTAPVACTEPKSVKECVALLEARSRQPRQQEADEDVRVGRPPSMAIRDKGTSPTYDDACDSYTSSSWDSGSSFSDQIENNADEESNADPVPMSRLPSSMPGQASSNLEIGVNEDTDYLQPVCSKGNKSCRCIKD